MRGIKWICLTFVFYALSLSGCGKREIVDTEKNDCVQNTEQPENEAEAEQENEQEKWWSAGDPGHGSLSSDETKEFLKQYGFEDQAPFYVYRSEEGVLLELYYDTENDIGCGIRYGDAVRGTDPYGFAFCGSRKTEWEYWNPFSVTALYDNGAFTKTERLPLLSYGRNISASDYEEKYEYNEQGQPVSYRFSGVIDAGNEMKEKGDILRVDFLYRPDGTLCEKKYSHNVALLGESYCEQRHFYDEKERPLYTVFSMPRSSQEEVFYLYEGDGSVPAYCLELNEHTAYYVSFHQFVETSEDWKWIGDLPGALRLCFMA